MARFLTLAQAKNHLQLGTDTARDDDLQLKIDQAEAFILEYIARRSDTTWTATIAAWTNETVPLPIQAAIMRMTAKLFEFRGDEGEKDGPSGQDLQGGMPADVRLLLGMYRDPVVA